MFETVIEVLLTKDNSLRKFFSIFMGVLVWWKEIIIKELQQ